jgi:hypothetical protein
MKPSDREEDEYVRDQIDDATAGNDRGRKHAEGAFGGNIGNDISDGANSGGQAALAADAAGQSAIDRGEPITQMHPDPVVDPVDDDTSG